MARMNRIRKIAAVGVRLIAVLFIILLLACGGQTGNNNLQSAQKPDLSGIKHNGQTGISQQAGDKHPYVPDQVMVKFKSNTDAETIERIRTSLKLETLRKFSSPNLFLMKITDGSSVEAIIERLTTYEAVKYAEPNHLVKATQ